MARMLYTLSTAELDDSSPPQVSRKVQNTLGTVADTLEKIQNLLTWKVRPRVEVGLKDGLVFIVFSLCYAIDTLLGAGRNKAHRHYFARHFCGQYSVAVLGPARGCQGKAFSTARQIQSATIDKIA